MCASSILARGKISSFNLILVHEDSRRTEIQSPYPTKSTTIPCMATIPHIYCFVGRKIPNPCAQVRFLLGAKTPASTRYAVMRTGGGAKANPLPHQTNLKTVQNKKTTSTSLILQRKRSFSPWCRTFDSSQDHHIFTHQAPISPGHIV
jgi:hypothetical protein